MELEHYFARVQQGQSNREYSARLSGLGSNRNGRYDKRYTHQIDEPCHLASLAHSKQIRFVSVLEWK